MTDTPSNAPAVDAVKVPDRWEVGFRNIASVLVGARSEFDIPDIVERVRSLAAQAPGAVKAIDWVGGGGQLRAVQGDREYWLCPMPDGVGWSTLTRVYQFGTNHTWTSLGGHKNQTAAKAAAQADYEARILSALSALSAAPPVAREEMPSDGTCARCGSAPRNASGLCATCVDEDAVRAGEVEDDASQDLWRQTLDQERVPPAPSQQPAGEAGGLVATGTERSFVEALQGYASFCETLARTGSCDEHDLAAMSSKFRDAAFVVDQLEKLRDGKIALGMTLVHTAKIEADAARIAELEAEVARLKGALTYIAAQAKAAYPTVLSVIRANAEAVLDDEWQKTASAARAALGRG